MTSSLLQRNDNFRSPDVNYARGIFALKHTYSNDTDMQVTPKRALTSANEARNMGNLGLKVCVVGIWHLGSVASTCFADLGYHVVGVDRDPERVRDLNKGVPPLFEPGLAELMMKNLRAGRLSYTTELSSALKDAEYVLLAFDTPVDVKDEVDLSEIFETSGELGKYLKDRSTVIVSSQVPIGTSEQIKSIIKQTNPSPSIDVAYVPEFLRLGQAIERFMRPKAVIIGADNDHTAASVESLYGALRVPMIRMSLATAEMTKHVLNAFLALPISFINEIANLSDMIGVDTLKIAEAVQRFLYEDKRIWSRPPLPGLGFSGGTLARDLNVLRRLGEREGYRLQLTEAILDVNERQNKVVERKLEQVFESLDGLVVGALGLTYKPGTSTLRRSAAIEIIQGLASKGVQVKAYDPKVDPSEVKSHKEFEFCADAYEAAGGCDALILLTEWPEFRELDFKRIRSLMKMPFVIDVKNALDGSLLKGIGFTYLGVGTGSKAKRISGE